MPTLTLTEAQQLALRALMTIEPAPGCSMPSSEVLRLIETLVPCDAMGVGVVGNDGCFLEEVVLPSSYAEMFPEGGEPGPLFVGVRHWGRHRAEAEACGCLDGTRGRHRS